MSPCVRISLVLSESVGNGHGSGNRLPVATAVASNFLLFVIGADTMTGGS